METQAPNQLKTSKKLRNRTAANKSQHDQLRIWRGRTPERSLWLKGGIYNEVPAGPQECCRNSLTPSCRGTHRTDKLPERLYPIWVCLKNGDLTNVFCLCLVRLPNQKGVVRIPKHAPPCLVRHADVAPGVVVPWPLRGCMVPRAHQPL